MDLKDAQQQFLMLVNNVQKDAVSAFLKWAHCVSEDMIDEIGNSNEDIIINELREDIKCQLPVSAIAPTESIIYPQVGDNADCDPLTTAHVDGFLYDDDDVDELCDKGEMSRNYCTKCGSHNVQPLTFISHSSSVTQLKFMFQFLLPAGSLSGKKLLDIGSRLGAVIYGAALYNKAKDPHLIGCEMNAELCKLQSVMVKKYRISDYARVEIINSDITSCPEIVQSADVIVMNNIFDFFAPIDIQSRVWKFLRLNVTKPGTKLILSPVIEHSVEHLQADIDVNSWLKKVDITEQISAANLWLFGSETGDESDLNDIHLYTVI